jgi:hypothetical protein
MEEGSLMPGFNNGYQNNNANSGYYNGYSTGYQNNNIGYNNLMYPNNNQQYNQQYTQQYGQQPSRDDHFQWIDYVNGRAGADAYQLPTGVNKALLFDNDYNRFFIKSYDNNGRPRIFEDNDYCPHVEPEPVAQQNIDLSAYATKEDIRNMVSQALGSIQIPTPKMDGYVTMDTFNKVIDGLSVGNGGRIVRNNEQNA